MFMQNHTFDGVALRSRRELKGFTSGDALASAIGISGQHLLRIERGVRQPSADTYRALLRVLGAKEGDFLRSKEGAA